VAKEQSSWVQFGEFLRGVASLGREMEDLTEPNDF
jgi:hypothetical protein